MELSKPSFYTPSFSMCTILFSCTQRMKKKIKGKQSPFFFASETDPEKPKYTHRYPTRMNDFYKNFSDGDPRRRRRRRIPMNWLQISKDPQYKACSRYDSSLLLFPLADFKKPTQEIETQNQRERKRSRCMHGGDILGTKTNTYSRDHPLEDHEKIMQVLLQNMNPGVRKNMRVLYISIVQNKREERSVLETEENVIVMRRSISIIIIIIGSFLQVTNSACLS